MINEPKPIPEPSKTPQEVKIVSGDSTKVFKIGSALPALEKEKMVSFLRANMFSLGNTRICPELIGRSYNIDPECKPVQQKQIIFAPEHNKTVTEEVEKLLEAGFIREVFYLDWLANVVMVKKEQWQMEDMR